MLTSRLRDLEAEGTVLRQVCAWVPLEAECSLSPLGRGVEPALLALER